MQAVVLEGHGGPEVLRLKEIPSLEPGGTEVRVRVHASALNRADVMQSMGQYPPPGAPAPYEIPGLEFAGVVDELGPSVSNWQIGDRVFGLLVGGGYAEQVLTDERMLMAIPENLTFEEAAAIPEVFFTAYNALLDRANFQAGDIVLIHAGAGGVGTAAIQLAHNMGASIIFTTSRTEWKLQKTLELGANRAINTAHEDFEKIVKEAKASHGADVILDFIGASYLEKNLNAAALEGRLVQIGTLGSPNAQLNLGQILSKRLRLQGTTLRSLPIEQKMTLTQKFAKQMLPFFAAGRLKPIIDRCFELREIVEAHRYMESSSNFGKIVLKIQ
ncbi:MAG: NAD(P)H-quinone oxidoreductase [Chroococcidiopsidaceae cyanobacterium CP_BM_RX_35]|nr:NAD(P)H-quinone oxidoreductase [Chroococcidiopsidaceae cyanobacterium CP_BM_RX_35]